MMASEASRPRARMCWLASFTLSLHSPPEHVGFAASNSSQLSDRCALVHQAACQTAQSLCRQSHFVHGANPPVRILS